MISLINQVHVEVSEEGLDDLTITIMASIAQVEVQVVEQGWLTIFILLVWICALLQ
jgi:hypothetical protein